MACDLRAGNRLVPVLHKLREFSRPSDAKPPVTTSTQVQDRARVNAGASVRCFPNLAADRSMYNAERVRSLPSPSLRGRVHSPERLGSPSSRSTATRVGDPLGGTMRVSNSLPRAKAIQTVARLLSGISRGLTSFCPSN